MSMSFIKFLLLGFLFLNCSNLFSQDNFASLGESSLALNHKVSNNYKINFALRYRYFLFKNNDFDFENRQLDFVHFSTFSLNQRNSLSLGIQYRNRTFIDGGSDELRITQQYNNTKRLQVIRLGHRFRLEQRILENLTIIRSRYRLALDFPLNGQKLDINESYLIIAVEGLLSNSNKIKPEIDFRTTSQIGWLVSERSKIQLGLEYRLEALNIKTIHLLFITTSFIYKL